MEKNKRKDKKKNKNEIKNSNTPNYEINNYIKEKTDGDEYKGRLEYKKFTIRYIIMFKYIFIN